MIKDADRLKASQIAQISASGGLLSGTNLQIIADSAYEAAMDRSVLRHNYAMRIKGLRDAGAEARYQGRLARYNARMRAFADIMGTAGSAAMLYGKRAKPTSPKQGTMGWAMERGGATGYHQP